MGVLISERERCERLYHDNPKDWDKRKYLNRLRKQIAYAAWKEGHKLQPVPAIYYVTANRTYCGCVEPRQVYSMGTVVYCTVCGKPIIGSVSG